MMSSSKSECLDSVLTGGEIEATNRKRTTSEVIAQGRQECVRWIRTLSTQLTEHKAQSIEAGELSTRKRKAPHKSMHQRVASEES